MNVLLDFILMRKSSLIQIAYLYSVMASLKLFKVLLCLFLASKAGMYIMSICVVLFLIFYLLDFLSSSYC